MGDYDDAFLFTPSLRFMRKSRSLNEDMPVVLALLLGVSAHFVDDHLHRALHAPEPVHPDGRHVHWLRCDIGPDWSSCVFTYTGNNHGKQGLFSAIVLVTETGFPVAAFLAIFLQPSTGGRDRG